MKSPATTPPGEVGACAMFRSYIYGTGYRARDVMDPQHCVSSQTVRAVAGLRHFSLSVFEPFLRFNMVSVFFVLCSVL